MKGGAEDLQAMSQGPNSFNTSKPSTWLALSQTWGKECKQTLRRAPTVVQSPNEGLAKGHGAWSVQSQVEATSGYLLL